MKSNGSRNFLIGIVGIIIILFLLLQIVSTLAGNGAIAADNVLPNSLSTNNPKPTADDFYKAASGEATIPVTNNNEVKKQSPQPATTTQTKKTEPQKTVEKPAAKSTAKAQQKAEKKPEKQEESMVTVSVTGNVGRAHPFLPAVDIYTREETDLPKLPYSKFHQPPIEIEEDPVVTKLMETTISGIMFDTFAPSAIINVEGQDHLVRKGDRINGYKVLDITKNRVVVQNGTNIYRATVGETLTTKDEGLIFNEVYDLHNKFAGANAPEDVEYIQIR